MIEELDFYDFCIKNHITSQASLDPFSAKRVEEDLLYVKVIKRQLSVFVSSGRINTPLLLNNTIVFFNCFDEDAAQIILLYKIRAKEQRECIKSVLLFLTKLSVNNYFDTIQHDQAFFEQLLKENPEQAKRLSLIE